MSIGSASSPTHKNFTGAGRPVRQLNLSRVHPFAGCIHQGKVPCLYAHRRELPGFVPHGKPAIGAAAVSKGNITFQQKLLEGSRRWAARWFDDGARVFQNSGPVRNAAVDMTVVAAILVLEFAAAKGETVKQGTAQSIDPRGIKPFREEIDSLVAAMLYVRANVQETMGAKRIEEEPGQTSANTGSHVGQGKRDETDKCASLEQIECERNGTLEFVRVDFEMQENDLPPFAEPERFAGK